jgi:D-glycero-alpha-D-manno-heptose 1-phosphate guanylyltransferase
MTSEAIILAGGLGTRLRSAVPDLPKAMAMVAGRPFLAYVIQHLTQQGIDRFIFSLGYRHELIEDYLSSEFSSLNYSCSIEEEPLGTGGGILKACLLCTTENAVVANGDTLFAVDIRQLSAFHESSGADCTLTLKPMRNSDRYGVVETANDGRIISFKEKKWYKESLINGGVYTLNVQRLIDIPFPEKFSFEKDYLESFTNEKKFYGSVQDRYFIDIGIPEDYQRAQEELKNYPSHA